MHPHILEYWVFVHAGSACVLCIPWSPNQGTPMYLICRQTKGSIVCEPLTLKFWCHRISVLSCHHHPSSMLTLHMTGLQHLMILHHITMSYLSALWSYKLLRWPPAVFTHRKKPWAKLLYHWNRVQEIYDFFGPPHFRRANQTSLSSFWNLDGYLRYINKPAYPCCLPCRREQWGPIVIEPMDWC